VVVNDVSAPAAASVADTIRASGGLAVAVPWSVSSWSLAASLVDTAVAEFGRLDGLVANAGITHHAAPWDDDEQSLRRLVETNVLGTQFCATHALRAMNAQGTGGSIVTVVSGARLGIAGMSAYGATKGAVAAMTAAWAIDCASRRIRVNAVSPLADTDMAVLDARPDRPTLGAPEDVAPVVVALLSDVTAHVTGRIVRFDGARLGFYAPESVVDLPVSALTAESIAATLATLASPTR
jgi:NAD(P)-dependent dehydrogenase (short-subunit alcohol dehydrogenase family)